MTALTVTVYGDPKPQGSKRHVGRGILVESGGQAFHDWRHDVTAAARTALADRLPLTGPVGVLLHFAVKRPKSAPAARRYPDRRPDIDKLARTVLDALTAAGAWEDDSQVVNLNATKVFPGALLPLPGVVITVVPLEEQ